MADAHKERVGAAIRERREELDLSQATLAARIPVAEKTLRRWESGESFGHMDNLEKLAEELETTVDQLMAGPARDQAEPTPDLMAVVNDGTPTLSDVAAKLDLLLEYFDVKADDSGHPATRFAAAFEGRRARPAKPSGRAAAKKKRQATP